MASRESIAMTRDYAVESLLESGRAIASILKIDPPDLSMDFRDKDLQQAEELKALAAFNQRVQVAIKGMKVDKSAKKQTT